MSSSPAIPALDALPEVAADRIPLLLVPALALLALPLTGSFSTWVTLTFAGLAMGMIIFIIASGLTLVFGLMDVLNFGHGVFITLGAFLAVTVLGAMAPWTTSDRMALNVAVVLVAMLVAMVVTGAVGLGYERLIIRPVYGNGLKQILITMGGMIVGEELIKVIWGPQAIPLPLPTAFRGSVLLGEAAVERYRLIAVVIGLIVFAAMMWVLSNTKVGLLIRAGVHDREMVESLGYHIRRLFVGVFVVGSALAGLGGVMWGLYQQGVTPQMGSAVNVLLFIVIIIGGMGSVGGCFIGALLVGLVANYTGFLVPKVALFSNILLMVVILLWRPAGLYSVGEALMLPRMLSGDFPRSRALAVVLIVVVLALALAPFVFPGAKALNVAAKICVFIVLVASFDLLLGYTGIVSFAHTMFFGIGAYGVAIAITRMGPTWAAVAAGVAVALLLSFALSLVIGLFSLRVKAMFYAMITLAVAVAFQTLASQLSDLTGGEDGLSFKVPELLTPGFALREAPFLGVSLNGKLISYYLLFAATVVLFLVMLRIVNSPFGRVLQAIRENEFRAEALGYRTVAYRTASNVLSASFATLAGALLALWLRYNGPDTSLSFEIMIDILLIVVIGGMGTLYGAVVGSAIFIIAQNYLQDLMKLGSNATSGVPVLRDLLHPDRWLLWLGLLFIVSVYRFPIGIVGKLRVGAWVRARARAAAAATAKEAS